MDTTTGTPTGGEPGGATPGQVPPPGGTPPAGGPRNSTESFFEWIDRLGLRRTDERWLSGTAGGVARRLGVDPLIVRGLWFVLCLVGGVGLILYAIGWALLPDDRDDRSLLRDAVQGQFRGEMVGPIVAFILGVNWRLGAWSWWHGDDWVAGIFWLCLFAGVAVVVAAVVGSRSKNGTPGAPPQQPQGRSYPGSPYVPVPSGDVHAAATSSTPTTAFTAPATGPYPTTPVPPDPSPVATKHHGDAKQRDSRDSGRSGAVASAVVGLCLVAGAVVFGLDRGGHVDSPWLVWGGVSLVLLGLGTVVAGLRGRGAGGLTTLAILLGVVALPVASLDHTGAFDGDVRAIAPDTTVVATDVATAEDGYTYSVGNLTLDLASLPLPSAGAEPVTVPVHVGAGDTVIQVPRGAEVRATVRLWAGDVSWQVGDDDQHRSSHNIRTGSDTFETPAVAGGGTPQLVLDVTGAAGTITIEEK
ncbi:hypothetical protein GCM10023221_02980 [Luteimicrobium xylanilyticum]|uniref:Phage shock protein PspC N-terminal domain-containing protein n=1 Tax=Luteimicrobium xylanilyticum TaxID=1133546 RepID=A0A5P9Q7J7_9MICO|nr:PspC domain-containing protein [Luteimicrobium xylanilyticum]QFU97407.1 hypothetical protein KDY119_00905 [Luteimicrobium xylanilyticum]